MQPNRRAGLAFALLWSSLAACSSPPKLQPPQLTFGGVGGNEVYAMARGADGTTYFGGNFTSVSVTTGAGLAFDGASGLPKGAFPKVEGEVKVVIPDGRGGWYLGGLFRSVGGLPRENLAHLTSDSQVDAAWEPKVDGPVYALALQGGGLVLVGGDFHSIGTVLRRNLAAIDVSGNPTAWAPAPSHVGAGEQSAVYALAVRGSSIYVGGDFTIIGATTPTGHSNLAVVDTSGTPSADWVADMDEPVRALLVTETNLYVGGGFTRVLLADTSSVTRAGLASFTLADGKLDQAWNPGLVSVDSTNAKVYALATIGNTLYVGGQFKGFTVSDGAAVAGGGGGGTTTSTVLRSGVAALDASGKVLPAWDPALSVGGDSTPVVNALAASDTTLYIGGRFISSHGTSRTFGAAVDGTSSLPTGWNPAFDGAVEALATRGDTVFAGGAFLGVSAFQRNRLAAIAADGTLSDWNPSIPSGHVDALAVEGDIVYVGGWFQSIGGQGRANLAAIDKNGVVQAWNPGATYAADSASGHVYVLAIGADAIYVGGAFDKVGNETRTNLAAVDRAGQVTAWNPGELTGATGGLLVSGSDVFCSGLINTADVSTYGVFHYTAPSATSDWSVPTEYWYPWSLALESHTQTDTTGAAKVVKTLLVAGEFTAIGTSGSANLAAIDVETHEASTTVLVPAVDGPVGAMTFADGKVYIVGGFTHVTSPGSTDVQERAGAAAFELASGALTSWQPDVYVPTRDASFGGLAPVSGGIDIFGGFTSVDGKIGCGLSRVSR